MRNPIDTLEQTWKIVHPSGHSQITNKSSLMSTKNQTNPTTPETQNLQHRTIQTNKATPSNNIAT